MKESSYISTTRYSVITAESERQDDKKAGDVIQHLRLLIKRSFGKPRPPQPRLADPAKLETSAHPTDSIASCAPPRDAHPIFYGSEQDRKISLPPDASHPTRWLGPSLSGGGGEGTLSSSILRPCSSLGTIGRIV